MENIDFIPINAMENLHFIVKNYQRGYKWEKEQIVALLNDIENHEGNGKYCLQPIVVEESSEGIELIDGQQRITTIFLLLHYLGLSNFFTIDYQTRETTKEFIRSKINILAESIQNGADWDAFIDMDSLKKFDNVDVFHFHLIYTEIQNWFEKSACIKGEFLNKLCNQIYVIWYDIKINAKNQRAEDVFLNLNAGKIPLTNSELIKALFILDVQDKNQKEIAKLKAAEMATEWDAIENKLHENTFWYFICDNDYYNNQDTRIDFIIDLANEITPKKDWDGMDSYRKYEKEFLTKTQLDWGKIKQTYNKLQEWFDDKEIYHYVGYLVVTKIKSLKDLVKESKGKDKEFFKSTLIEYICEEFRKTETIENEVINYYCLEKLDYQEHRIACQNVLLLLNVQYYINNLSQNKFPFDLYKIESWSVEHINPQNPKEFKSINSILNWIESFRNYFRSKNSESELLTNIEEVHSLLTAIENKERKLSEIRWASNNMEKLQNVIDNITNKLELHGISNLALLDRNTNSKLSNKTFMDKRIEVLDLYYKGKENNIFIPECTRDVFTKNFTKEAQQVSDEIFGLTDMDDYKKHISNQLKNYYHAN